MAQFKQDKKNDLPRFNNFFFSWNKVPWRFTGRETDLPLYNVKLCQGLILFYLRVVAFWHRISAGWTIGTHFSMQRHQFDYDTYSGDQKGLPKFCITSKIATDDLILKGQRKLISPFHCLTPRPTSCCVSRARIILSCLFSWCIRERSRLRAAFCLQVTLTLG